MDMQASRRLPALLVLGVLFVSQAAYAAGAFERPSGHCAQAMPAQPAPSESSCPLPLWLACCDAQAAVSTHAAPVPVGGTLALPLASAALPARSVGEMRLAPRSEIPPDTPLSRTDILQI